MGQGIPALRPQSLGRATLSLIIADGVVAVAMLAATPYLIAQLGVARYGIVVAVSILAGQLGILQLGIGPATTRRTAESRGSGRPVERIAALHGAILVAAVAAGLIAIGFVVVAGWVWQHGFQISPAVTREAVAALPAAAAVAAAQPLLAAGSGFLFGDERFPLLFKWRLFTGLIRVAAMITAVASGGGVVGALIAHAVVDGSAALMLTLLLLAENRGKVAVSVSVSVKEIRALLAIGLPFAVAEVFAALLLDAEKLIIGFIRSLEEFTYYTVPFAAVFRLAGFAVAVSNVLMPRIAAVTAAGNHRAAADLTHRATQAAVAGMFLVLAPLLACAPEILSLWLGSKFAAEATLPTRILLVGMLANAAVYPSHAVIRARARPSTLARLYSMELPLHLALVYVGVQLWGTAGAAMAWTIRVVIDALAHRVLAHHALKASIGRVREFLIPLLTLGALATFFQVVDASLLLRLASSGVLMGVLIAWFLFTNDRSNLWRILRSIRQQAQQESAIPPFGQISDAGFPSATAGYRNEQST